jgi:Protein of unknown function (DUF2726)
MLALGADGQDTGLAIIIALAVVIVVLIARDLSKPRWWRFRTRYFRTPFRPLSFNQPQRPDITNAGQQLHAVMAGSFEKQRVLSPSEYRVFAIVEVEIAAQRSGYRVFAQSSLGEILKSSNEDAFRSINSKRVDILVVDRSGWPFLAVEYQGNGHYQGTAAARDAIKKEALRKAGVRYMEFSETDTDDQIRSRLREHLTNKAVAPAKH